MGNTLTVFRRELGSYFTSPIAYIFVCLFLVFMGVYPLLMLGFFKQTTPDIRQYFDFFTFAFVLLIPPLTMRIWSEEKKSGTVELLMTFPFRSWEVVLGKFFAGYVVVVITLLLTITVPLSMTSVLELSPGIVVSSYVGAILISAVYLAIGTWASSITENQIVALLVSVVLLAVLATVGFPGFADRFEELIGGTARFLGWFGFYSHYEDFVRGVINPVDLVYVVTWTAFFLVLSNFAVELRKFR